MPSEPALAAQLGISRGSVRSALAQLESEGLISRRHGAGTYVNSIRPLVQSLHLNIGAEQLIRSSGHEPGIKEMSWKYTTASQEIAERLGVETGDPIIDLYRVRTSDDTPVSISHNYIPQHVLPDQDFMLGSSLYVFLDESCGITINFGIANLEPATAGDERAAVFGVEPDALCFVLRQTDYDTDENPVLYSVECHLARAFDFRLVRQGPAGDVGEFRRRSSISVPAT